jgi:WD40 repeat protein
MVLRYQWPNWTLLVGAAARSTAARSMYCPTVRPWEARTGRQLADPIRTGAPCFSAHLTVDGEKVVTSSSDGTARIWEARTGRSLTGPLSHGDGVILAVFSPDGTRGCTL